MATRITIRAALLSVMASVVFAAAQLSNASPAPMSGAPQTLMHSDVEIADFFDDYIARTVKDLEIPGGAAVVLRNGKPILAKGYGYADVASRRPVSVEDSIFRAASISKILPWLLTMQLVEEGRLDLDRDINAYLDFEIPEAFGRPITMRHLMTHTAGFPEHFHGAFEPDLSTPLGEMLRNNIPERVYPPGTTVAYSNHGAALAGYIVERLRGEPWERVVAERIFKPVGMRHSTVAQPVPPSMLPSLASTYSYGDPNPGEFRSTSLPPMGALSASAGDMGRLLAMLANGGQGVGGRVVAPATVKRMIALQKRLGPGLDDGLGLGFMVGTYRGVRYAGHAGNMSTLATDLEILPDHGLAWYFVFNSQGPGEEARKVRYDLLMAAIDRFVAQQAPPIRARGPSSARDVAGTYISTRRMHFGPLMFSGLANATEVAANRDGTLTIESSGTITHWLPAGRDRFVEKNTGIALAVTRGPDGPVERFASALLYPVAEFERRPSYVIWTFYVAAFSFGILLITVLAAPFATLLRRRKLAAGRDQAVEPAPSATRIKVRRWARSSLRMLILTTVAWGLFGLAIAIDFTLLFTLPALVRIAFGILTLLSAPFAAIIVTDVVLAFRDPGRGWFGRVWAILLAAAASGLAWVFYVFDVINFSTNW